MNSILNITQIGLTERAGKRFRSLFPKLDGYPFRYPFLAEAREFGFSEYNKEKIGVLFFRQFSNIKRNFFLRNGNMENSREQIQKDKNSKLRIRRKYKVEGNKILKNKYFKLFTL